MAKANEVYLLTTGTDYGGECPRAIFSTIKLAETEANKIKDEDTVNIYLIEIDYDYDYDPPCVWSKRPRTGKMVIGKEQHES